MVDSEFMMRYEKEVRRVEDKRTKPYMEAAKYLAESYSRIKENRDWLRKRLAGSWVYTREMAIAELDHISISYDSDRVQTSNISNPTERIALKLTDEYMAKKQAGMDAERDACASEIAYLEWKIGIVETAGKERLKEIERWVFTLLYIHHKTFEEISKITKKKKHITIANRNIVCMKQNILDAFMAELALRESIGLECFFLDRLIAETRTESEIATRTEAKIATRTEAKNEGRN